MPDSPDPRPISVGIDKLLRSLRGGDRRATVTVFSRWTDLVGESVLSPAMYSMAGDNFPEKKLGRALSVFLIGLPLGVGLALVIGGLVVKFVATAPQYDLPLLGTVRAWQLTF